MSFSSPYMPVIFGFLLTLVAHVIARLVGMRTKKLPVVITALFLVIAFLWLAKWPFDDYFAAVKSGFDRLLGYVTVALAIPLAAMRFDGFPLKRLAKILILATLVGALLPMALAYALNLSHSSVLAFATRAVTTPIGLNISAVINSPAALATLIIIISGLVGGAVSPLLLARIDDDRAKGLALGLVAHALGTAEAWQISTDAGRYAAFGMAVNGMITAIWLPIVFQFV